MGNKIEGSKEPFSINLQKQKNNTYSINNAAKDISGVMGKYGALLYAPDLTSKYIAGLDKAAEASYFACKLGGRAAIGVSVAYGAYETYDAYKKGGTSAAIKKGTKVAGGIAGSYAGAKLGAVLSAKPAMAALAVGGPIAAGAVVAIGTTAGAIAGYFIGEGTVSLVQYLNE